MSLCPSSKREDQSPEIIAQQFEKKVSLGLGGRGTILHRDHKETALRAWIGNLDNS